MTDLRYLTLFSRYAFESGNSQGGTKLFLQSVPLSLRAMFDQYFQLGDRVRKHYLSARVAFYLATGQFVPPIHRKSLYSLQYSMLPARRADIAEVWERLTEARPSQSNGSVKIPNGTRIRRAYR